MKYYLHDSNAFNDEKITELFMEFGYEGLGLFYTLLEKIASQEKPIKTSVLKSQLKVGKKLERCWSFMESIELIHSNNGETFNKQLMNFSEKYKIKKESNAKRVSEWRERQSISKSVTHYESVRNDCKLKESEEEIKKSEEEEEGVNLTHNSNNRFFVEIDKLEVFLTEDLAWCEVIASQNKLGSAEKVFPIIREFIELLKSRDEKGKTLADAKSHFANWLNKQKVNNKQPSKRNLNTTVNHSAEKL